eukprot:1209601-Rhodomonas_salina.4
MEEFLSDDVQYNWVQCLELRQCVLLPGLQQRRPVHPLSSTPQNKRKTAEKFYTLYRKYDLVDLAAPGRSWGGPERLVSSPWEVPGCPRAAVSVLSTPRLGAVRRWRSVACEHTHLTAQRLHRSRPILNTTSTPHMVPKPEASE